MYRVVLYARVSKENTESLESQKKFLLSYITENKAFQNSKIILKTDNGYSGTNFERPAIKEIFEMAKESKLDCIIVKDFSRFARNSLEVITYIEKIFPFLGVRFISINDNYDSDNFCDMDIRFKNLLYSLYSQDLSRKILSAQKEKAEKGLFINAKPPFGYKKSSENINKLVIDEKYSEIVKLIFEMSLQNISTTQIAKILNNQQYKKTLWRASDIAKILEDERYLGKNIFRKTKVCEIGSKKRVLEEKTNWVVFENSHEVIIQEEVFDKVKAKRENLKKSKNLKKVSKRKNSDFLFSRKIFCGECNYALIPQNMNYGVKYKCLTYQVYPKCSCGEVEINENELTKIILKFIESYFENVFTENKVREINNNISANKIRKVKNEIELLTSEIYKYDYKLNKLYENLLNDKILKEEYIENKKIFIIEKEEIVLLKKEKEKDLINFQKEKINAFNELKRQLTRQILDIFVNKIIITDKVVTINWNFKSLNKTI